MPRFKQVQKVNTSLHLLTSGLGSINFHWHLKASWDDPCRLLSGLLSSVPLCSRTGIWVPAPRCDPQVEPRRCSPKLGLGWMLCGNGITPQLSRAVPSPHGKVGKCLSLSRADHCWAGSCVPSQKIPSLCQFPELPNFLQDGLHPRKFCFVTVMWMVTTQTQTRACLLRAEQESLRYLKFKASQSFQNYFSWGVFVTLQSWDGGMVPVFKHK